MLGPAGVLTALGSGTAGAAQTSVTPSSAVLGPLGSMTLKGLSCTVTVAGTHQCTITGQFKVTKGSTILTTLLMAKLEISVKSSLTINSAKIKSTWAFTIKTSPYKSCKITVAKVLTFAGSGRVLSARTITIPAADITGTAGSTCTATKITTIKRQITGAKLDSTITF